MRKKTNRLPRKKKKLLQKILNGYADKVRRETGEAILNIYTFGYYIKHEK